MALHVSGGNLRVARTATVGMSPSAPPARAQLFADRMLNAINNVQPGRGNVGPLYQPLNDNNLLASKWSGTPPCLPAKFAALLPFGPNEPVTVHARYRYGQAQALLNVWITSTKDPSKGFSMGFSVDPKTGAPSPRTYMNQAGSDDTQDIQIDVNDAWGIMDALFANNPDYRQRGRMSIGKAFQLGTKTQTNAGAEPYTVVHGQKEASVPTRNGAFLNGFRLNVSRFDQGSTHTLVIELTRYFEPSQGQPHEGDLKQGISVELTQDGRVRDMKRESEVQVYDTPVNGVSMTNEVPPERLPQKLRAKLYPDAKPTVADFEFFERLVSKPLTPKDISI